MSLIDLLILLIVAGLIAFLIRQAPFIDEPYKTWALYAILVFVVLYIVLSLVGGAPILHQRWGGPRG